MGKNYRIRINNLDKETLEDLLDTYSGKLSEVLFYMGYTRTGSSYARLRRRADQLGVSLTGDPSDISVSRSSAVSAEVRPLPLKGAGGVLPENRSKAAVASGYSGSLNRIPDEEPACCGNCGSKYEDVIDRLKSEIAHFEEEIEKRLAALEVLSGL